MKNIVKVIFALIFLGACNDDDELKVSIVETFLPSNILTTTATLNGEIEEIGTSPITEHGFIWSTSADLSSANSTKILLGQISSPSTFSATIEMLEGQQQYYFAAFFEDGNGTTLGETIDFNTAAPVIKTLSPSEAVTDAELAIEGDFFPENEASLSVYFDDKKANIISSSITRILVNVPAGLPDSPVKVKVVVGNIEVLSDVDFTLSYFLERSAFPHVIDLTGNPQFLFSLDNSYYFRVGYDTPGEQNIIAFWKYDAASNEFTRKADFPFNSSVVPLYHEGKGYIVTGTNNEHPSNELWEYDHGQDLWKQLNDSIPLPARLLFDFSFSLAGKSYVANGYNIINTSPVELEYFTDLWMYDHLTQSWSQKNDITIGSTNVIIFDGKAYVGPHADNKFWRYNEQSDGWVQLAGFPVITDEGNTFNNPYFIFTTAEKIFYGNSVSGEMWSYDLFEDKWVVAPGSIFKDRIGIRSFQTETGTFMGFGSKISSPTQFQQVMKTWQYIPSD